LPPVQKKGPFEEQKKRTILFTLDIIDGLFHANLLIGFFPNLFTFLLTKAFNSMLVYTCKI
ncbi:MAG: hypothetical protein QMD03_09775, partial [Syntrophales bacterium]|nr:hypothetical protein [Syntrophales bacterium]